MIQRLIFHTMTISKLTTAAIVVATLVGCGGSGSGTPSPGSTAHSESGGHEEHAHAHPTEGPHHGDLIELGNEEFHAEITHSTNGEVTIYVLDSSAKAAVPIDATEIMINLSHDGEAEQFKLPAAPDTGDPEGKSSRFTLKDEHLVEDLDSEGTVAKVVLTIDGKQYTGKIEHDHNHEGHNH